MMPDGFYNMDCLSGMKEFPDNYFDLAIVDPPYGSASGDEWQRFGGRFDKYKGGGWNPVRGTFHEVSTERAGHGRRLTEKNCCVGHGPAQGVF